MKRAKRFLALLLSIVMILGMLPISALAAGSAFSDVKTFDWFYNDVQYVCEKGLMNGTGSNSFSPKGTTTRGMIVTILYRMAGAPAVSGVCPFKDVAAGAYYEKPVIWAAENNIVSGYSADAFGPDGAITREQLAAILYRYAKFCGYDVTASAEINLFTDAGAVSNYALTAMKWASAEGLINGSGSKLDPQGSATRAQVAAILTRFCKQFVDKTSDAKKPAASTGTDWNPTPSPDPDPTPEPEPDDTVDSDNDGLSDELEAYYGTNKDNPDTDGDGFDDFAEIYLMGTDPLIPNEPNSDTDGDGISDNDEINKYQTDINSTDTDCDGLSDFDEINIYGTDPTKEDTDGDGLSDGFEVKHGLDPTKQSTDGTTNDGNVPIDQVLEDVGISLNLKDGSNLALPSIQGKMPGEMADYVFLASSGDSAFEGNRALVGYPVNVEGNNEYVSGLTLSFDVSAYEGDTTGLSICIINSENVFELVDTTVSDNVLSCTLDGSGTYFVMNIDQFLKILGIDLDSCVDSAATPALMILDDEVANSKPNEIPKHLLNMPSEENIVGADVSTVEKTFIAEEDIAVAEIHVEESPENVMASYTPKLDEIHATLLAKSNAALMSTDVKGQADIVFVIDTTGSMSDAIDNVITNVSAFATALSENYNVQINYGLIDFKDLEEDGAGTTVVVKNGSSNWFSSTSDFVAKLTTIDVDGGGDNEECDVDALETARRLDWRASANKFIVLITDADYKVANSYGVASMEEEIALLAAANITVSVVTTSGEQSRYQPLYETTGGIYANIYNDFSTVLISLADLIGEKTSDGSWVILKHGYRYVKLPEIPTAGSTSDFDGDGYTDYFELGEAKSIDLTPFIKLSLFSKGIPFEEYIGKTTIIVYDAYSDPTKADTDNDGIIDTEDTAPWTIGLEGGHIGTLTIVSCYTDQSGAGGWTQGHAFLVHNSLVNNTFDFSAFITGCETDEAWANLKVVDKSNSAYKIRRNSYLSIGGFQSKFAFFESTSGAGNGVYYNYEFYSYFARRVKYLKNAYLTKDITYTQMQELVTYCSQDSVNYWSAGHNCSTIACDSWNEIYETGLTAKGLYGWHIFDTPTALKNSILEQSGSGTDYQIANILN